MKSKARITVLASVAALIVAVAFAGAAQAAGQGQAWTPDAFCQSNSTTLSVTGLAGVQAGYSSQYITARFALQRKESGAVTYTAWQTKVVRSGVPENFGADIAVARGHYWVWVQYGWYNGSAWTDINGVARNANSLPFYAPLPQDYHYYDLSLGFALETLTHGDCPVATTP